MYRLNYPVFGIDSIDIETKDGIVFADGRILDDTNIEAETLGERRLRTPMKPLYRINKMAKEPRHIIIQGPKYYIDNYGKIFYYEKQGSCRLKYHKILKQTHRFGKTVIQLQGIYAPFTIPREVPKGYMWAGVLYMGKEPWMLYNYSINKEKNTTRKV